MSSHKRTRSGEGAETSSASKRRRIAEEMSIDSDDDDDDDVLEDENASSELLEDEDASSELLEKVPSSSQGWVAVCEQFPHDSNGAEMALALEVNRHRAMVAKDNRPAALPVVKSFSSYRKNYAAGLVLLGPEQMFCFAGVTTPGLRSWSMVDLASRVRHFMPLLNYCAARDHTMKIGAKVALQIYDYPMQNISTALASDYEQSFKEIFQDLVLRSISREDVEAIEAAICADQVLGDDVMASPQLRRDSISRIQNALRQYCDFWHSEEKKGPKELLACIISLLLFVYETSAKCVYTRMRISTKFFGKTFPHNEVSGNDGSRLRSPYIRQMCTFMHRMVQNQHQARVQNSLPSVDNVPFISYSKLASRYIYSITAILSVPGTTTQQSYYAGCADVIMSSFAWVCANFRKRKSPTKSNEVNISYRRHIGLHLDQYRLLNIMVPMSTEDHKKLKKMLHDNFRGGGATLALVVKENSILERYLVKKRVPLPGRSREVITEEMKRKAGITPSTINYMTGQDIALAYKQTLSRLEKSPAIDYGAIIREAKEVLASATIVAEIPEDAPVAEDLLVLYGGDTDDDDDTDEEEECMEDVNTVLDEVLASSKEAISKRMGGQKKSAAHHELKKLAKTKKSIENVNRASCDPFPVLSKITEERLNAFNQMISYFEKGECADAESKAYDEYYAKLTKEYTPSDGDDLCVIETYLLPAILDFSNYRKSNAKTANINSLTAARSVYIGLLLKFALQRIAPPDQKNLVNTLEWYRVRKHSLLSAGYKWLKNANIPMRDRDLRRYLAIYDLSTMYEGSADWTLRCNLSYTKLTQRSDYLYSFFRHAFVRDADPLRHFELQEFIMSK